MSQICEAGKLREADFGRESETWLGVLGEGRGRPWSQDSSQHVPAKLHIFVVLTFKTKRNAPRRSFSLA